MSKISTLLVAGGGGTVAAASGAYLIKNGLGRGEIPEVSLLFESVEKFEEGGKDEKSKCVHNFFEGGFDANDNRTTDSDLPTTGDGNFFNTTTDGQTSYKSCVLVDWKRENYEGDKGKGKFTGTGTFVKGNEGFVNFNVAETISDTTNKLKFTGVFYLVGKDNTSSKGKVKHKKEVKGDTKKIGQNNLDHHFPKRGEGITVSDVANDYGGFFKNSASGSQLDNVCGEATGDCTTLASNGPISSDRIELSGKGTQHTSGDDPRKTLKSGSENLTGGESIYGGSSWSLKAKLVDEFKGQWSKVTTSNS